MKKINVFLLLLATVITFSCSKDDILENKTTKNEFTVDTMLVITMINNAQTAGPALEHFADSIAKLHKGVVCPINYKSIESTIRKCWTDSCQADELKDLVRLTIACPFDSLKSLITDLANTAKKKNEFYRYKHQEMLDRGYWGDMVNLKHAGSIISEIQVKSHFMSYATYEGDLQALLGDSIINSVRTITDKDPGGSHHYYEIIRDITGKYSEAEKAQALKDSYDYLHAFWESYQPGMIFYTEK